VPGKRRLGTPPATAEDPQLTAARRAQEAPHEADAVGLCLFWFEHLDVSGGGAALPEIAQCLDGGYGWLQVKCRRCETYASIPLEHIDGPRDTPQYSPPHT
jgi:hypothetical protein